MGNADSVCGATVDAGIVAGMRCRAGPIQGTVLVGDALHASATDRLVVGIAHKKADQGAATLGDAVLHDAEGVLAAVKVRAAVDTAANACSTGQTEVSWAGAVAVSVALVHGNGHTASSTLRVAGEAGLALALALVLHGDALAVRCTGEVDAGLGTAVNAEGIRLTGGQRGTLHISGALLLAGNALLIQVSDVAVIALTVRLVFHRHTVSTRLAAGKLASVEAFLDAVIQWLANVRLVEAVAIQFALIALLLSAAILQVVCIAGVAGVALAVSSVVDCFASSVGSTGDARAGVQAVQRSGGGVLTAV